MAISYRYHVGSLLAVFLALLLGVLIGIGLTSRPEEFEQTLADLQARTEEAARAHQQELDELRQQLREQETIAKAAVAAVIANRLAGKRVAVILNHQFGRDPLPDTIRATLAQAGATVTSITTITREFVTLPPDVRQEVGRRLLLYPPPGTHLRSVIADAIGRDLARGQPRLLQELVNIGLLRRSADSDYSRAVDAVVLVGGMQRADEASVDRIDLPLIDSLLRARVRVVGCEASTAPVSCIPAYASKGIATVDNADTLAGRMALVLAIAGANGRFGTKETAERLLPEIPSRRGS